MKTVNELIKDINSLTSHLHEKDFLLTWEQTPDELKQVLDVAAALKALRAENISTKVFNSGLGISVVRVPMGGRGLGVNRLSGHALPRLQDAL